MSSDDFGDFSRDFELRDGAPELAGIVSRLEVLEQCGESGGFHHGHGSRERVALEERVRGGHFAAMAVTRAHASASVAGPHFQTLGAPGAGGCHSRAVAALPPAGSVGAHV